MKQITIYFAIITSLLLTACGGSPETKKTETEQKTPSVVTNSNTANVQNQTTTQKDDKDADDFPVNKPSANTNANITKSQKPLKKDTDDLNKKGDADDRNGKNSKDKDESDRDDDDK